MATAENGCVSLFGLTKIAPNLPVSNWQNNHTSLLWSSVGFGARGGEMDKAVTDSFSNALPAALLRLEAALKSYGEGWDGANLVAAQEARDIADMLYEEAWAETFKALMRSLTMSLARVEKEMKVFQADASHPLGAAWGMKRRAERLYQGMRAYEFSKTRRV